MGRDHDGHRADRQRLRDALHRRGHDSVDQIAQAIREHWHHGHLRSYRLALELSQQEVCDRVNAALSADYGDPGWLDMSTLSKFEHWPEYGRRPSAGYLIALAEVFGTCPHNLIADVDWDAFPPLDQHTLRAVDHANSGSTEPAGGVGMMDVTRPPAGTPPRTLPTWRVPPELIESANPTEKAVIMTSDESTRYADRGGNTGPATIDELRDTVTEISGRFVTDPRNLEFFGSVRMLRDRIFTLLDGGQSMAHRRDLFFLSAVSCGLLAGFSDDLGYPAAGMSQVRVGHIFAAEVGDPGLTGWLYAVQSMNCYWNGQPGKARDYARRGTALGPGGTVGVFLPALEARASGALGDAQAARAAVRRAAEIRQTVQPGTLDAFGGKMYYTEARQHFHAADAFLGAGDDQAAIAEADTAVRTYRDGPAENYNYMDLALTHFDAAIARTRHGDLDAAAESATTALRLGGDYPSSTVDKSARRLHHQLCAASVQSSPLAVESRDQIEDFLSLTPTRPELL